MKMKVLDLGLKSNWIAFKDFVKTQKQHTFSTFYFVYEEDDCGDEVVIFTSHSDLDEWLEKTFWNRERYDTNDLESSMDDFNVWKLIPESEFKRLPTLYKGAKETSIEVDGEKYYRKLISISVEPTVNVSTNFY